ncbi:hypothetical protein [Novosphingobium sp. FSW06-99]|uniref:hypothetical protein n=1 Tax=Novosphingobium sp. FSW06-99 TaxID=1739113 RepID=UPI00076D008A|nr:hypothetical protein [Novosphingobium sp. FSW06-99]KUR80937.1 hypothetical protein AQZ49_02625 [Novosphingobium sp. FSW06-99]
MIGQPPRARLRLVATDAPAAIAQDLDRRIAASRNMPLDPLPPIIPIDYPAAVEPATDGPAPGFLAAIAGVITGCLLGAAAVALFRIL